MSIKTDSSLDFDCTTTGQSMTNGKCFNQEKSVIYQEHKSKAECESQTDSQNGLFG